MKRNTYQAMTAAAGVACAALAGAAGCGVESNPKLTISRVNGIILEENACRVGEEVLPTGVFDAGTASDDAVRALGVGKYLLGVTITNNLPPNDDDETEEQTTGRLNTNKVQINEVVVTIDNSAPWTFLPTELVGTVSFLIDSGDEVSFPVTILDERLAQLMIQGGEGATQQSPVDQPNESFPLNISVLVRGETLDGDEIESNVVTQVVSICNHCLDPDPTTPENDNVGVCPACSLAQPDGFTCGDLGP